jgi:hypothetical protein
VTPYQAKFVTHIIKMSKFGKEFANAAIDEFAAIDPYNLKNLRELVRKEVMKRKEENGRQ